MIDVSSWNRDYKSQASGARSKYWLTEPEKSAKYLFKMPTKGTGGHWAELIASRIGKALEFNTVDIHLAKKQSNLGVISKNFRSDFQTFYEGGDLFYSIFTDFDRNSLRYYELPNILYILKMYNLDEKFVMMPVFDTLIANNDRHCDNWGVLQQQKDFKLSPIYDNGSSLGFNETILKKEKMLTDKRMLQGFCNRGKPCIGLPERKKPKHFELLSYLDYYYPLTIEKTMEQISNLNKNIILSTLNEIPDEFMNEIEKAWVLKLLLYRKDWMLRR